MKRPPTSPTLTIFDQDGAHLFSGESLLGLQLGALRVAPRRQASTSPRVDARPERSGGADDAAGGMAPATR